MQITTFSLVFNLLLHLNLSGRRNEHSCKRCPLISFASSPRGRCPLSKAKANQWTHDTFSHYKHLFRSFHKSHKLRRSRSGRVIIYGFSLFVSAAWHRTINFPPFIPIHQMARTVVHTFYTLDCTRIHLLWEMANKKKEKKSRIKTKKAFNSRAKNSYILYELIAPHPHDSKNVELDGLFFFSVTSTYTWHFLSRFLSPSRAHCLLVSYLFHFLTSFLTFFSLLYQPFSAGFHSIVCLWKLGHLSKWRSRLNRFLIFMSMSRKYMKTYSYYRWPKSKTCQVPRHENLFFHWFSKNRFWYIILISLVAEMRLKNIKWLIF